MEEELGARDAHRLHVHVAQEPDRAIATYARNVFPLVAPIVIVRALLLASGGGRRRPAMYLVGLYAMAVLYSLYYAWHGRSPYWWAGIAFVGLYATVLIWQTYWAVVTARRTAWGTRSGRARRRQRLPHHRPHRLTPALGHPGLRRGRAHRRRRRGGRARGGRVIERELPFNLVRGVLAWVVGLIAIPLTALPFVAYAHYSQEGRLIALHVDRAFRGPAFAPLDRANAKYVARHHLNYSNAVMVLNVHAVMDGAPKSDAANPESSVLPVKLFAADMQMLRDAGYHTVTPEQITAWREGSSDLPHNALLLTFDDGRTDTVLNAAPILRRVGFRATVFAIGDAWKKSPLYEATPEGLRSLQRQGWSIEAHASAPHSGIDAGDGESFPYLSARRTVDGRLETLSEFRSRAAAEYRGARVAAEKIANRPVVAFAWPFGAYGADTRTNDARVAAINLEEARRVYSLGFNEDGQTSFGLLTRDTDPMLISRFEIVPTLSPRQLFERLELAIAASAPEVSRAG